MGMPPVTYTAWKVFHCQKMGSPCAGISRVQAHIYGLLPKPSLGFFTISGGRYIVDIDRFLMCVRDDVPLAVHRPAFAVIEPIRVPVFHPAFSIRSALYLLYFCAPFPPIEPLDWGKTVFKGRAPAWLCQAGLAAGQNCLMMVMVASRTFMLTVTSSASLATMDFSNSSQARAAALFYPWPSPCTAPGTRRRP